MSNDVDGAGPAEAVVKRFSPRSENESRTVLWSLRAVDEPGTALRVVIRMDGSVTVVFPSVFFLAGWARTYQRWFGRLPAEAALIKR